MGFSGFKTPNRGHSMQLRHYSPSTNVRLDEDEKHLHVPAKLGRLLIIKRHCPPQGTPVTAHLVSGGWALTCTP